ncbi:17594_t:CDS:2 [Gigaspora margarita]|uniref:17594_t:CDS:1 n=1 Tax=Gigaspora margarita TaxID=4874 RepID=A0ABM8W4A6_GIGMA|nr:17594_t:CDS:2 [Gigaspora margarita]
MSQESHKFTVLEPIIRYNLINSVWEEATLKVRLYDDFGDKPLKEWRKDQLRFFKENTILTPIETQYFLDRIIKVKNAVDARHKLGEISTCTVCNSSPVPYCIIEWIKFCDLENIEFLDKGGFGEVYSAVWTRGEIVDWNATENDFVRQPKKVALKFLIVMNFLAQWNQVFNRNQTIRAYVVGGLGFTRNHEGKYMIVLDFCESDLRKYLQKNRKTLSWKDKVKIAWDISVDIQRIAETGSVHDDLHPANILLLNVDMIDNYNNWVISDLGTSSEILFGHRPPIIPGTPKVYADLMPKCWNKDPYERVSARDAAQILRVLLRNMMENSLVDEYSTEKNQLWNLSELGFTFFRTSELFNLDCVGVGHTNSKKYSLNILLVPI